jgi:hypothetical protein
MKSEQSLRYSIDRNLGFQVTENLGSLAESLVCEA